MTKDVADLSVITSARGNINHIAQEMGTKAAECEVILERGLYETFGEPLLSLLFVELTLGDALPTLLGVASISYKPEGDLELGLASHRHRCPRCRRNDSGAEDALCCRCQLVLG
jgi:hypothetical protein